MDRKNTITKVAFTGNTELTLKCMATALSKSISVIAVFGIPDEKSKDKTNYVSLDNFCRGNSIKVFKSNDWDEFKKYCKDQGVDTVITIGDSRIVPKQIIDSFYVIGNHGAILPNVQGGASLVWGRLLNCGVWGISIMEIDEKVDSGTILKTKEFSYKDNMTELEFVNKCDNLTVEALVDVLNGNYQEIENRKCDVRISKHTDSESAVEIMRFCLQKDLCIYMPPRTEEDGQIKEVWSEYFKNVFKIAQNKPYPKWKNNND